MFDFSSFAFSYDYTGEGAGLEIPCSVNEAESTPTPLEKRKREDDNLSQVTKRLRTETSEMFPPLPSPKKEVIFDETTPSLFSFLKDYRPRKQTSTIKRPPWTNILSQIEFEPQTLQEAKQQRIGEAQRNKESIVSFSSAINPMTVLENNQCLSIYRGLVDRIFKEQPYLAPASFIQLTGKVFSSIRPLEALICIKITHQYNDFKTLPHEDKEIVYMANLCFAKCVETKLSPNKSLKERWYAYSQEPEALQSIVLPALVYRNIFLRSPFTSDYKAARDLYVDSTNTDYDKIEKMIENPASFSSRKNHYMVFATSLSHQDEIVGFLHFDIRNREEGKMCCVRSLKTEKDYKRYGIGTLLMAYAYTIARAKNCKFIDLSSLAKSFAFYLSLGFKPNEKSIPLEQWQKLSSLQKYRVLKESKVEVYPLEFNCLDPESQRNFQTRIANVLNPEYTPSSRNKSTLDAPLPKLPLFVKE